MVDAGSVMMARPMRAYAKPGRWLLEHYCFEYRLAAFDVYRRRPDGVAECAQPYVPLPYDAVNWNGTPMGIPVPLSAERARERRLPYGNLMRPIWFPSGPPPQQAVLDAARDPKTEREEAEAERDGFYIPRFDGRD